MKNLTKLQKLTFSATLTYAAWIRLQDLGYSEYQGDEILTLDFAEHLKQVRFLEYLLTRDKGPLQYIINLVTYKLTGGFDEFWIRLPYALIGFLFVWAIFEVTRGLTYSAELTTFRLLPQNNKLKLVSPKGRGDTLKRVSSNNLANWAGIIAAWFAASNGLFIAFSRITQYQAFVQLLLVLTVLALTEGRIPQSLALRAKLWKEKSLALGSQSRALFLRPLLAGLAFGLATLFHYDALTFLAFACFYFGKEFLEIAILGPTARNPKFKLKNAFVFFSPFLAITSIFYLPFFLHSSAGSTSGYLAERVFGSGFMPRTLYTEMLMKFYMPKELLYALVTLSCLTLWFILRNATRKPQPANRNPRHTLHAIRYTTFARYALPSTLILTFWFSTQWIKPRGSTLMFYTLTIFTLFTLFFNERVNKAQVSLFAWFLTSSCFYLFFNKTPRTHVYILFIPMFILSGYSLVQLYQLLRQLSAKLGNWLWPITRKTIKLTLTATTTAGLIFIPTIYNYNIFVNKKPEYLWGNKNSFGREMIHIEKNIHSKVDGIFGFPQNRHWRDVALLFKNGCLTGTYQTNEKDRIPAFYLGQDPVNENADNIILVESPVSWNYQDLNEVPKNYRLLKTYYIGNHPVTTIFGKAETYPNSKMLCE